MARDGARRAQGRRAAGDASEATGLESDRARAQREGQRV